MKYQACSRSLPPSQPPQRSMWFSFIWCKETLSCISTHCVLQRLWLSRAQVSLPSLSSPKHRCCTSQCAKLQREMASCDCNEMASGFNPLLLHQKALKSLQNIHFFSAWCRVSAQHLACGSSSLLKNDPYNFTLCPSRLFFLSPPPQAHFFLSSGTNTGFFPAILPFSYFINSGHNAFDVIFGSAPGLGAHWPARHSRRSVIF